MAKRTTTYTDKNNLYGPGAASSMEALLAPFSRFDFTLKWRGADGAVDFLETVPIVRLMTAQFGGTTKLSVQWSSSATAGCILETISDSGGAISTRDKIDPGFGTVGSFRDGKRYSFVVMGGEYRVYENFTPSGGRPPIAKAATPAAIPFPLWLVATVPLNFAVLDIMAGGTMRHGTIYSAAEKIKDRGTASGSSHYRIFQKSRYTQIADGIPVDIDF